jgi:hypothetical protein
MSSVRLAGILKSPRIRLLVIASALTAMILAALVIPAWFFAIVPRSQVARAALVLLLAAQPAYGVVLVVLVAGLVTLGPTVIRARRHGQSRPRITRLLLLSGSGLLAIIMAESAAAGWRAWANRIPALPDAPARSGDASRDDVKVVVIGDSSAYGLPFEKWLSTGRIVTWKLGQAIPDRRFHLDVLAEPGVHLESMHQKLAKYRQRIDLLIIYSGHNEFTRRYRWERSVEHYVDEIPFRPYRLVKELARRYSPLCRMIQEAIEVNGLGDPPPPEVTRQLVDIPACTVEEYAERLDDFRRRLEAIVAHCDRTGILAVLLIPPGNDSGFEPNRSVLPAGTRAAERAAFARQFLAVRAREQAEPAAALDSYRAILADHPGFAEAHFRLARLLERSLEYGEANRHYLQARDNDGLPMRCPGAFQEIYRDVAARHPRAILVDGQAALAAASPTGIPGDWLFLDAMHPNVRGHALLAQAVLAGLKARRAFGWPEESPAPDVDPTECAAQFGVGPEAWRVACHWGATFYERTAHIRYDPSERLQWIERYRQAARSLAGGADPDDLGLPGVGVRPIMASGDRRQTSIGPKRASGR